MRVPIDPEKFMERLRAGFTPAAIFAGRSLDGGRVRGIGSRRAFIAYCAANPEWGREAQELARKNLVGAHKRKGALKRNQTHCKYGHPLTDDNVYKFPYRNRTGRKCKLCTARNCQSPPPPTEDQIRRVTAALNVGQTLSQICTGIIDGRKTGKRIIGFNKLKVYREQNPDFDRFICLVAPRNTCHSRERRRDPLSNTNILRAERNDYHLVAELVPANLPRDIRDDIIQSIFIALLEGSLRRDQVKDRIRQFITAHNREANRTGVGKYGLVSLDAPIFSEGNMTLVDTVSQGIWD